MFNLPEPLHICSHKLEYHKDIILYVARNNIQELKDKIINIKVTFCDLYLTFGQTSFYEIFASLQC